MFFPKPVALAMMVTRGIFALPTPNPAWDSANAVAVANTCKLGMALVAGACVAAATLEGHSGTQIGGATVGIAGTAIGGAHSIAKELKDGKAKEAKEASEAKEKEEKDAKDTVEANHNKAIADNAEKLKTMKGPPNDKGELTPPPPYSERQKQAHKMKGWS